MPRNYKPVDLCRIGVGVRSLEDLLENDPEFAAQLPECNVLNLHCNAITSLSGLNPPLYNLREINLSSNLLTTSDWPELSNCLALTSLDLSANRINNLSLPFLPGLVKLSLAHNPLISLEGIHESVPALEELDIRGCLPTLGITSYRRVIVPLRNLKSLCRLFLTSTSSSTTPQAVLTLWDECPNIQSIDNLSKEEWRKDAQEAAHMSSMQKGDIMIAPLSSVILAAGSATGADFPPTPTSTSTSTSTSMSASSPNHVNPPQKVFDTQLLQKSSSHYPSTQEQSAGDPFPLPTPKFDRISSRFLDKLKNAGWPAGKSGVHEAVTMQIGKIDAPSQTDACASSSGSTSTSMTTAADIIRSPQKMTQQIQAIDECNLNMESSFFSIGSPSPTPLPLSPSHPLLSLVQDINNPSLQKNEHEPVVVDHTTTAASAQANSPESVNTIVPSDSQKQTDTHAAVATSEERSLSVPPLSTREKVEDNVKMNSQEEKMIDNQSEVSSQAYNKNENTPNIPSLEASSSSQHNSRDSDPVESNVITDSTTPFLKPTECQDNNVGSVQPIATTSTIMKTPTCNDEEAPLTAEWKRKCLQEKQRADGLNRRLVQQEAAMMTMRKRMEAGDEERSTLAKSLEEKVKECARLGEELCTLSDTLTYSITQNLTRSHNAALEEMQSTNSALREDVDSLKLALKNKEEEFESERDKWLVQQKEYDHRISEREETFKQEIEKMHAALATAQQENDELRRQHALTVSSTTSIFTSTLSSTQALNESLKEQLRVAESRLKATQEAFETVVQDLKVANRKVSDMTNFSTELKSECAEKIKALTDLVKRQQDIIKTKSVRSDVDEKLTYLENVLVEKVEALRACEEREKVLLKRLQSLEESERHLFQSLEKERDLRDKEREREMEKEKERSKATRKGSDESDVDKDKEKQDISSVEARVQELFLALKVKEVMLNDQAAVILSLRNKLTAKDKDLADAREWVADLEDRLRQGSDEIKELEIELAGKQAIESELKALLMEMSSHKAFSFNRNPLLLSQSQSMSSSESHLSQYITSLEDD